MPKRLIHVSNIFCLIFLLTTIGITWLDFKGLVDSNILSKRYAGGFGLLALLCILIIFPKQVLVQTTLLKISVIVMGNTLAQALFGCFVWTRQCILGHTITFNAQGSFDNPVGFALCVGTAIPFVLYILNTFSTRIKTRIGLWFVMGLYFFCIVISGSRTLIFAILVTLLLHLTIKYAKWGRAKQWAVTLSLPVLLLAVLYNIKIDSANGRLLIWRCTIKMIANKPVCGYGLHGFRANYMNYQADYLSLKANSRLNYLADNIQMPFNDYLATAVAFGLIGLIVLGVVIVLLFRTFLQNKTSTSNQLSASILSIITIAAFFSYPSAYAIVWLTLSVPLTLALRSFFKNRHLSILTICAIRLFCIGFIIVVNTLLAIDLSAEIKWGSVYPKGSNDSTEWMDKYAQLETQLGGNPFFLYNYSALLYEAGLYQEAIDKAELCRVLWADYDVEMLLGQAWLETSMPNKAEPHLLSAAHMCPNRFFPLYYLMKLYYMLGNKTKTIEIAKTICDKSIKIKSRDVSNIKREAFFYLKTLDVTLQQ